MSQPWNPRPYMEEAMEFALKRDGSGLMLDPGMGKTSITLAVIDILRSVNEIRKTLVVAPVRVCQTVWRQEGAKWSNFNHLKIVNLHGLRTTERAMLIAQDHHVYLINPESLVTVLPLVGADFDLLVLDESTKFKDTQTQRFKALKKRLFDFKRRMILTGTPVPNGLQDLFGQMFCVDLGASLGKYISHFRMEFMHQRPGDTYGWHLNRMAPELIYARVANRLMRLDARDHLDMPELLQNYIKVALPDQRLRKMYDDLERDFVAKISDEHTIAAFNPAAVGTKLRQMANGFIYEEAISSDGKGPMIRVTTPLHTEKLDALEELIEEMQGRPLLIAYEFEADWEMMSDRFPMMVNLGKEKNADRVVNAFNDGAIPLLAGQAGSIGHGINLQAICHDVCWYGITWNLEHYIQLNDRVYRQGQPSPYVTIHHIVCEGTKDEDVMAALEGKDRTQSAFNRAIKKVPQ